MSDRLINDRADLARLFAHEEKARDPARSGAKVETIRSIWTKGGEVVRTIDSIHAVEPRHREGGVDPTPSVVWLKVQTLGQIPRPTLLHSSSMESSFANVLPIMQHPAMQTPFPQSSSCGISV